MKADGKKNLMNFKITLDIYKVIYYNKYKEANKISKRGNE